MVISNLSGNPIEKYALKGGNLLEISISNYPAGIYMVQYTMEIGTSVQERFVKL